MKKYIIACLFCRGTVVIHQKAYLVEGDDIKKTVIEAMKLFFNEFRTYPNKAFPILKQIDLSASVLQNDKQIALQLDEVEKPELKQPFMTAYEKFQTEVNQAINEREKS